MGPDPEPDAGLDPLRMGLARVYSDTAFVGYLSTRVDVRRTEVRRLGRRALLVDPHEFVEWFFEMTADWPRRHPDGWDDGWEHQDEVRTELLAGQFVYPDGPPLTVEWVDGTEATVWREHYAFADRHEETAGK